VYPDGSSQILKLKLIHGSSGLSSQFLSKVPMNLPIEICAEPNYIDFGGKSYTLALHNFIRALEGKSYFHGTLSGEYQNPQEDGQLIRPIACSEQKLLSAKPPFILFGFPNIYFDVGTGLHAIPYKM